MASKSKTSYVALQTETFQIGPHTVNLVNREPVDEVPAVMEILLANGHIAEAVPESAE